MNVGDAVLVTTEHRGVFYGKVITPLTSDNKIELADAQMAAYWSPAMRGVFGLASIGPDKDCRIGGPIASLSLVKITAVAPCSPQAVERFKIAPWS